jgi:hypothetical protein
MRLFSFMVFTINDFRFQRVKLQLALFHFNTLSVVHFRSSPLSIPDPFYEPFPCPFNTMTFDHSTARRFVGFSCKTPTKVHLFSEIPSSSIQHVNELPLFLNFVQLLQDTLVTSHHENTTQKFNMITENSLLDCYNNYLS